MFSLFILPVLLFAQPKIYGIDDIVGLQNTRELGNGKLYTFLHSADSFRRARALCALANIQDSASVDSVIPLLNDTVSVVRQNAAFAIGQIGDERAAPALFERLKKEDDSTCLAEELNGIGKCGNHSDLVRLGALENSLPREALQSYALSIARFALRGVKDSSATFSLLPLLSIPSSIEIATYALMRINDTAFTKCEYDLFAANLKNGSDETRMWTATLLGSVHESVIENDLIECSSSDSDWRVRVNAIRSLRNFDDTAVRSMLMKFLDDKNEHISLTAFSILEQVKKENISAADIQKLKNMLVQKSRYSWRQRGEAAIILAKVQGEKSVTLLSRLLRERNGIREKVITALGETKSLRAIPFVKKQLAQQHASTVIAAIDAYAELAVAGTDASRRSFCEDAVRLLQRGDVGISYEVAVALQDSNFIGIVQQHFFSDVETAFKKLNTPIDVEPMVEFIHLFAKSNDKRVALLLETAIKSDDHTVSAAAAKALNELTGKNYDMLVTKQTMFASSFFKESEKAFLTRYRGAEIMTNKGAIVIAFRPDAAPFTVLNFILLARRHFYDGLKFHRVVSNFVIQGGDPRGDGSGGPGYAIRTEVSPDAVYTTGAVGMASAGKDTEGSQFFITHCPTPHLDGRYTIFAYTTDRSVVDNIQVGDAIFSVTLVEK